MTYEEFLSILEQYRDEPYAKFQEKLILSPSQKILGVRTPIMRKLAKEMKPYLKELFAFPDEYFEVTFIKLAIVSSLPYAEFLNYVPECVKRIDNWATCDCFKAACIKKNRDDYLSQLESFFKTGKEFYVRYTLVTLLSYYIDDKYLDKVESFIKRADTSAYYVYMAVAWLVAEILIKRYERGVAILKSGALDKRTHNKAIQKAKESFRITKERKEFLNSLKIK